MADSCIISKEQLSQKEQILKSKLYGSLVGGTAPSMAQTQQKKTMTSSQSGWRGPSLYQEKSKTSSPQKVVEHHKTQLKQVTDQKMETFIDEMRQQFMQTQNASAIPQSILYQQTRMMEKQVQILEDSQKNMAEVINNVMNQGATGQNNPAALRQQVFSENRRMMMDMFAPLVSQVNEMKVLYESTKSCSSEVGNKIDELKRLIATQSNGLTMGSQMAGTAYNPFQSAMMGTEFIDPNVIKKGLEDIKEQMRDTQREAHLIESDMERRHQQMIQKSQQSRYLPQSLTEEFSSYQQSLKEQTLNNHLSQMPMISKTRDAVLQRMGGPFDYGEYIEDLRIIVSEKDQIEREFKAGQLWAPEFKDKAFGKVEYDFSVPMSNTLFSKDMLGGKGQDSVKITNSKPTYYNSITTEPKYMLDFDIKELQQTSAPVQQRQNSIISTNPVKTVTENKPSSSIPSRQKQTTAKATTKKTANNAPKEINYLDSSDEDERAPVRETKQSQDNKKVNNGLQNNANDIKNKDILSLKKMVIEEIKSELQLNNGVTYQPKDPHREYDQKYKDSKDADQMRVQGARSTQEDEKDRQQVIFAQMQKSQILSEMESNRNAKDPLRASVQSITSHQSALSETMIMNTIADMILKEVGERQESAIEGIDQKTVQQMGEDMLMEKIKGIFDEVARDRQEFEESYQSTSQANMKGLGRFAAQGNRPDLVNTSIQVIEQSLQDNGGQGRGYHQLQQQRTSVSQSMGMINDMQALNNQQQQPVIVPIVINQSNTQANSSQGNTSMDALLRNPNQLRDLISQTISAQLQLHNIKNGASDMRDSLNDPLNTTTRTMQEEEAKLKVEQQLLRKQIPINVHPYIQQTITQGPNKMSQSYQNPFFYSGAAGTNLAASNMYGINPPLLNDLDQFNLTDSSSDFLSMNSSQVSGRDFFKNSHGARRGGRNTSKQGRYSPNDDRSEGEVGGEESGNDTSLGEIRFPVTGASGKKGPKVERSALGQTINYEEDKVAEDAAQLKPIYESTEGPIPKAKGKVGARTRVQTGKSGANILNSGESFGMNPLRSAQRPFGGAGGDSKAFDRREKIADNFLEEEEDYQSSRASESGEIDPSLFR